MVNLDLSEKLVKGITISYCSNFFLYIVDIFNMSYISLKTIIDWNYFKA